MLPPDESLTEDMTIITYVRLSKQLGDHSSILFYYTRPGEPIHSCIVGAIPGGLRCLCHSPTESFMIACWGGRGRGCRPLNPHFTLVIRRRVLLSHALLDLRRFLDSLVLHLHSHYPYVPVPHQSFYAAQDRNDPSTPVPPEADTLQFPHHLALAIQQKCSRACLGHLHLHDRTEA